MKASESRLPTCPHGDLTSCPKCVHFLIRELLIDCYSQLRRASLAGMEELEGRIALAIHFFHPNARGSACVKSGTTTGECNAPPPNQKHRDLSASPNGSQSESRERVVALIRQSLGDCLSIIHGAHVDGLNQVENRICAALSVARQDAPRQMTLRADDDSISEIERRLL